MAPMTRTVVETAVEDGVTLELARREEDDAWEVSAGGVPSFSSGDGDFESALAELAIEPLRGRDDICVLIAGLGMGPAVRAALQQPGVTRVDVVEHSAAVIDWEARHFSSRNGGATSDPRVRIHRGELVSFLRAPRVPELPEEGWYALLLDVDEYPERLTHPGNAMLYVDDGLRVLEHGLRPGGVLGLWTTRRDDELGRRLHGRFQAVSRVTVPATSGLRYVYRGRRVPRSSS